MLGTVIEQNGDGLLEESHMPVGWPLHIDGAVRRIRKQTLHKRRHGQMRYGTATYAESLSCSFPADAKDG